MRMSEINECDWTTDRPAREGVLVQEAGTDQSAGGFDGGDARRRGQELEAGEGVKLTLAPQLAHRLITISTLSEPCLPDS